MFLDGSFVANTRLVHVSAGENFTLPLGTDDSLRARLSAAMREMFSRLPTVAALGAAAASENSNE